MLKQVQQDVKQKAPLLAGLYLVQKNRIFTCYFFGAAFFGAAFFTAFFGAAFFAVAMFFKI